MGPADLTRRPTARFHRGVLPMRYLTGLEEIDGVIHAKVYVGGRVVALFAGLSPSIARGALQELLRVMEECALSGLGDATPVAQQQGEPS